MQAQSGRWSQLVKNLLAEDTLLEIEAENYTPLWIGGYNGETVTPLSVAKVTGETLKGKLRYVVRMALAAALEDKGYTPERFEDVECPLAKLLGGTLDSLRDSPRSNQTHIASLVGLEVYVDKDKPGEPIVSLNAVRKAVEEALNEIRNKNELHDSDLISVMAAAGYALQLKAYDINAVKPPGGKAAQMADAAFSLADKCLEGALPPEVCTLYLLASIPRVSLSLMGLVSGRVDVDEVSQKIHSKLPLKPESVRICIRVKLLPHYYLLAPNLPREAIAKLVGSALIYVLTAEGIGKASSRGFGRFKILSVKSQKSELEEPINKLNSIREELESPQTHEKGLKELLKLMKEAASELLESLHKIGTIECKLRSGNAVGIPTLNHVSISVIPDAAHPGPYPVQWSRSRSLTQLTQQRVKLSKIIEGLKGTVEYPEVLVALNAIGQATMKYIWKIACGLESDESGGAFHTWLLGLPRTQRRKIKCSKRHSKGKNRIDLPTGYMLGRLNCHMKKLKFDCDTKKDKNIEEIIAEIRKWIRDFTEGRRKSTVITYPLLMNSSGRDNSGTAIAILGYTTLSDHLRVLGGGSSKVGLVYWSVHGRRGTDVTVIVVPVANHLLPCKSCDNVRRQNLKDFAEKVSCSMHRGRRGKEVYVTCGVAKPEACKKGNNKVKFERIEITGTSPKSLMDLVNVAYYWINFLLKP